MNYQYVVYSAENKIVKGTITAPNDKAAREMLTRSGYRILGLRAVFSFSFQWEKYFPTLFQVKPKTVILFSRELALLLESGIDIVTALELFRSQARSRVFRRVLEEVSSDLRRGTKLSVALAKHPEVFPTIYCRSLAAGEQTGGLEDVLRQTAAYMEKEETTKKSIKGALSYPIIVSVVAVGVVIVIVNFVMPSFVNLYRTLGGSLPLPTRILLGITGVFRKYGLYMLGALTLSAIGVAAYIRTPKGRFQWDRLALTTPLIGSINHLSALAVCCRTMAMLFRSGLPMVEIMDTVIEGAKNSVISGALTNLRRALLKGEGLSRPMSANRLFLPMMVEMVKVGEETGNLETTLLTVAETYDTETEDRIHALIGFIQPALTVTIGIMVGFIAISMLSAMYAIYGKIGK
ncbi:MAG: type II secretion system F family protein [Chloroflexota bacterium]